MRRHRIDFRLLAKAFLVFLVLMGFFLPALVLYDQVDRAMRSTRANFAATQVASRVQNSIANRVDLLKLLEYLVPSPRLETFDEFTAWSHKVVRNMPELESLKFIEPNGVVRWIVPFSGNPVAMGRNLLERPDVSPYLAAARQTMAPQLTHIVRTYQDKLALIIYAPLVERGVFIGWIDCVLSLDVLMANLLPIKEIGNIYVKMEFKDHPDQIYEYGNVTHSQVATFGRSDFEILNQPLAITVRYLLSAQQQTEIRTLRWLIFFGIIASSLTIAVLAYVFMWSRKQMEWRLEKEHFQSVLLNLMVHDIINPLLIVRMSTDAAMRLASPDVEVQLKKTEYGIDQMSDVIARVRDMRAVELGKKQLQTTAVWVNELIADTFKLFDDRLRAKGLVADFQVDPQNPQILVDRISFQNNVLNNLVANAIKFSESGGRVIMRSQARGNHEVIIEVIDEGVGMGEEIRRSLFLEDVDVTKPGTLGEQGTGIGMLQVKSYTRIFGGRVTVTSLKKTSIDHDPHGTTVRLYLPRA